MYPSHARAHVTAHDAVMACVARRHCSGLALAQTVSFISVVCGCISDMYCSTSQRPGSPTMQISISPQAMARRSKCGRCQHVLKGLRTLVIVSTTAHFLHRLLLCVTQQRMRRHHACETCLHRLI